VSGKVAIAACLGEYYFKPCCFITFDIAYPLHEGLALYCLGYESCPYNFPQGLIL